MIVLSESMKSWNSPGFASTLKRELGALDAGQLPLQRGLSATSYALDDKPEILFLSAAEDEACIRAKIGVFFFGIVAGCSCADDPTPVEPQSEYCEFEVRIDKATAAAMIAVVRDED
jgi:hypothetical protein